MGSQRPMTRQKIFLIVSTAAFVFIAAFVFTAANIVVIIIVLSAILVEVHQHCNDCSAGHKKNLFSHDA